MKTIITSNRVVLLLSVLLVIAIYLLLNKKNNTVHTQYQQLVDSLHVVDINRRKLIEELEYAYYIDSIQAAEIRSLLLLYYNKTETGIKTKHNEARYTINNMPTDSQLVFFSNWLSKKDSNK